MAMKIWKQSLALCLVILLLVSPGLQVSAEEFPEETAQTETTDVPETPEESGLPQETEAPAEPGETEPPEEPEEPGETEPPEEPEEPGEAEPPEEPEESGETEPPAEAELPKKTAAPDQPEAASVWLLQPPLTVARVLEKAPGPETLLMEATVVFASGRQAVLQDGTGGIRLSFAAPPETVPGDVLLVAGCRSSSGFAVEEFEKTGESPLPLQEADLTDGCSAVRILVKDAVLGYDSLTRNGYGCQLAGSVPAGIETGDRVDVCGVMLDGIFYADTITPAENQEPGGGTEGQWNFYFGQLHAHTDISDGKGTVEEAFSHAKQVENLDFFAVTDHSDSFENGEQGAVDRYGETISPDWAAGKAAAEAVTDETFVGIFGYEMTWPEDQAIGHISTFGTSGWQTRDQAGMKKLNGYLDALEKAPDSVSQFNHPGTVYGDFQNFSGYTPHYDARVHLLEVGSEGAFRAYDAYTAALDAGWHLAPSNNQNNHDRNWGSAGQTRTVVLAKELTEAAVYDAVRSYRVYATEDADLKILYHLNNRIMGSVIPEKQPLQAKVVLEDGSGDPIGRIEVVTDGGIVAASANIPESRGECSMNIGKTGSYYYLRILRNEEIVAVTAPVWVDSYEDLGIGDLTAEAEKPVQGTDAALMLTLFNMENLPFAIETVTFSTGNRIIRQLDAPGSVAPLGKLQIPLTYTQELPGTVTIAATVRGTVAGLSRSYQKTITLRFRSPEARKLPVEEVRSGILGEAYRIRGYVTAGTAKSCNAFEGSIYLQDNTGGMEIMDFYQEGIQLGTPMEIEGILRSQGGNLVLAMTDYQILEEDHYRFVPETMGHGEAMDYETHGGELMQLEGHVVSLTQTPDKLGVSRFTLRDALGGLATVTVEDGIGSGAYGTNELSADVKMTRAVRAVGLLHIDEYGETVLRVRNCDEVAYVPPRRDPSNPRTGDWLGRLLYRK